MKTKRKVKAQDLLGETVAAMIRHSPTSGPARALVARACRAMIPPECKTADGIFNWIEALPNLEELMTHKVLSGGEPASQALMIIPCLCDYTEHGTCLYRVDVSAEAEVEISSADFCRLMDTADNFNHLMNMLNSRLRQRAPQFTHDADYSDYDHRNYEQTDTSDWKVEVDHEFDLADTVKELVRANWPAAAARLGIEEE